MLKCASVIVSQISVIMVISILFSSKNFYSSCFLLIMHVTFHKMMFTGFLIASFQFFYYLNGRFDPDCLCT